MDLGKLRLRSNFRIYIDGLDGVCCEVYSVLFLIAAYANYFSTRCRSASL